METINFKVDKQIISCDRKKLVSDTINVYKCRFSFDEEWNEYSKTAVFLKNNESVQVVLNNNECVIPQEAVNETGNLYVGVFGTNTDSRYPTIYTTPIYVAHGCQNGSDPAAPTPDVYAQILNNYNTVVSNLNTEVTRAKARENEIENKIPDVSSFASQSALNSEIARATQVEGTKADKSTTYTKTEVDELVAQATPTDYTQVKAQVETNKTNIAAKQDKLTAGANITIENNVISVTGGTGDVTKAYVDEHLLLKVDKVQGKSLSSNDYTDEDKTKVANAITEHQSLSAYRTAQEQDLIHDSTKQDVLTQEDKQAIADLKDISGKVDKVTGMGLSHNDFTDTDKSDISTLKSDIVNKVDKETGKGLFSGSYNDLTDKPTIPTVDVNKSYVDTELAKKQATLVSGTNIKTINGQSLLGSGNIEIQGGGGVTLTIILNRQDGEDVNTTVTFTNLITEESEELEYENQSVQVTVEKNTSYKLSFGEITKTVKPEDYTGTATETTTLTFTYLEGAKFGFKRYRDDSNPNTRITYIGDNEDYTPFSYNFSAGTYSLGSWGDFIEEVCRPVMLNYDGTVAYELDRDDTTKKANGMASDITNATFSGNAMVEFRKYRYVSRQTIGDYDYVYFSNIQIDDTYKDYAFIGEDNLLKEAFYFSMFEGSYDNSRLRSIANQEIMRSQTATVETSRAKANGAGWNIGAWSQLNYIWDLLTLIGKSDNLQATFGQGVSTYDWNSGTNPFGWTVGQSKNKGAFFGESLGKNVVRTLYIEDLWGRSWDRYNGLVNDNGTMKAKMAPTYPTPTDSSSTYSNYSVAGITPENGYVKNASCSELGFIPSLTGGSETTYYCDYFYKNDSGVKFALVGGPWNSASRCGRYVNLNNAFSNSNANIGARNLLSLNITLG